MSEVSCEQVCEEFMRVNAHMKSMMLTIADTHKLTMQQLWVLYVLLQEGQLTMGVVAERLHCDASNITGIIDRLVSHGLVERKEAAEDRRSKRLSLTSKGTAIIDAIKHELPNRMGFDNLSAPARQQLYTHLQTLGI